MKKLLSLALLCVTMVTSYARPVELEWDDDLNPPNSVAKYGMYLKGNGQTNFTKVAEPTVLNHTFANLAPGQYSFYVTAISAEGLESEPSNTLTLTIPAAPGKLRIKIALETSLDDGASWNLVAANVMPLEQH